VKCQNKHLQKKKLLVVLLLYTSVSKVFLYSVKRYKNHVWMLTGTLGTLRN